MTSEDWQELDQAIAYGLWAMQIDEWHGDLGPCVLWHCVDTAKAIFEATA